MDLVVDAIGHVAQKTNIHANIVTSVLRLMITEECTVPFVARYRKEQTGDLDEVKIMKIHEEYEEYLETEKRRKYILQAIEKQEKLTPEIEKKINQAQTLNQLEDIYSPFKARKKTKGVLAKEAGLHPLAEIIMKGDMSKDEIEKKYGHDFLNPEKKIISFDDAINGAMDIIVETIAHDTQLKDEFRKLYWDHSLMIAEKKSSAETIKTHNKYRDYFKYNEPVNKLVNAKSCHRYLAIRRGMNEKVLKVNVTFEQDEAVRIISSKYLNTSSKCEQLMTDCISRAWKNYIHSSLDLELKSELKKNADIHAIEIFQVNLKNVLLAPYLGPKSVLGVDPAIRTGCKLAVIDHTGKYIVDTVIYPHPPQNHKTQSAQILDALIHQFNIEFIAIGNGTYCRETLAFFEKYVSGVVTGKVKATITSEAGASIYSTSDIARQEFPDKEPTVRSAVSIARRFQDPLAELVKIEPKSIGVGQYQHDVNQTQLKKSLCGVIENCVNHVGVDLNTSSAPLLSHISGINSTLAHNIVKHREKNGIFTSRMELKKIPRFSEKVFEQAAGFLRIYNSKNPLDGTFIHPESYKHLEAWTTDHNHSIADLVNNEQIIGELEKDNNLKKKLGEFTFKDIISSLKAPSQDPRTEFKSTDFRKDLSEITDIKIGEWYPGVVTNIAQFGAFVDIGIKENGLLHISQMADKFVENALNELKVGESVKVRVLNIDLERKRISLTRKKDSSVNANTQSTAQTGDKGKSRMPAKKQQITDEPLKNNPFAILKDFKLK